MMIKAKGDLLFWKIILILQPDFTNTEISKSVAYKRYFPPNRSIRVYYEYIVFPPGSTRYSNTLLSNFFLTNN